MARYLQLGRTGDVLAIAPFLYNEYQETGIKPELIIAQEYASILEGTSYIDALTWTGDWKDIKGASDWFGRSTPTQVVGPPSVVISQVYGKSPYKVDCNAENFVKEMWRLAGKLYLWNSQPPLVFDQRDKEREQKLIDQFITDEGMVIVADGGISSPFPYRKLLRELVSKRHPMLLLDEVKAHRFYDILGLYEHPNVRAIIATDSAPLHLAYAVNKPVHALVTDKPSLWHGSPNRVQHVTYTRYSNYPRDAVNILNAL